MFHQDTLFLIFHIIILHIIYSAVRFTMQRPVCQCIGGNSLTWKQFCHWIVSYLNVYQWYGATFRQCIVVHIILNVESRVYITTYKQSGNSKYFLLKVDSVGGSNILPKKGNYLNQSMSWYVRLSNIQSIKYISCTKILSIFFRRAQFWYIESDAY